MLNLVGNAIKFTEKGGIILSIVGKEKNKDIIDLSISVTDTGIGVSETEQETIFEAFKQSKVLHEKTYGGTGLGLSISKTLVEAMGGNIILESSLGKGSKFLIQIPNIRIASGYYKSSPIGQSVDNTAALYEVIDKSKAIAENILKLNDSFKTEIINEFNNQWQQLNNNHLINDIVSFVDQLLLFAKRKNNQILIEFCNTFLFNLYNYDIDNIEQFLSKFDLIMNYKKTNN